MHTYSGAWEPERAMVGHDGRAVSSDDDFFVPPPPEIGAVVTASATLKTSMEPTPFARRRLLATSVTAIVVFAFVWLLSLADWKPHEIVRFRQVTGTALGATILIAWLLSKPKYTCTYVGSRGIARFACYGLRNNITLSEIFRFDAAATLTTSLRNIYVNGGYLNTEYVYRWFDSTGNQRYKLAGVYRVRDTRDSEDDPYYVARSAEVRWTEHLLPDLLSSIDKGVIARFRCGRGHYLEVFPEYAQYRGKRFRYDDLDLRVEHGYIVFRRNGEKQSWYRLDRIPKLRYSKIHNATLLICVLQHKSGRDIGVFETASDARYHTLHIAPR